MLRDGREYVFVRKRDLPMPIVVIGDDGEIGVRMLEPSGSQKVSVRVGQASRDVIRRVMRLLGR